MAQFTKGAAVKQNIQPIQGTVEGYQVDQETGDLLVLVNYIDGEGHEQQRYFAESQLVAA